MTLLLAFIAILALILGLPVAVVVGLCWLAPQIEDEEWNNP